MTCHIVWRVTNEPTYPEAARAATTSAISSATSERLRPFASISSPMNERFGWHCSAHSSVRWLALRPMTRTKCQYFRALRASEHTLPMISENTLGRSIRANVGVEFKGVRWS
eukprot:527-Pelagococcus_subviridis.AAC.2